MNGIIFDETHRWPEGAVIGFDRGAGDDHSVHVRFTRSEKAWRMWLDEDGLHVWPLFIGRLAAKRFIREEIARRRLERFSVVPGPRTAQ